LPALSIALEGVFSVFAKGVCSLSLHVILTLKRAAWLPVFFPHGTLPPLP